MVDSSPGLFAVSHVLHRLMVPRHPPCALLYLPYKMLALAMEFSRFGGPDLYGAPSPKARPFRVGAGIRERNTPSELHRVPKYEREVEGRYALTVQARKAADRGPTRTSSLISQWFTGSRSRSGSR